MKPPPAIRWFFEAVPSILILSEVDFGGDQWTVIIFGTLVNLSFTPKWESLDKSTCEIFVVLDWLLLIYLIVPNKNNLAREKEITKLKWILWLQANQKHIKNINQQPIKSKMMMMIIINQLF